MKHWRRLVPVLLTPVLAYLVFIGWTLRHPPLSAFVAQGGVVPGGFLAVGYNLSNGGRFAVHLTGVTTEGGARPDYTLAMTSGEVLPSSIHIVGATHNYTSGDVRGQVIRPYRPRDPVTGVMIGWKGPKEAVAKTVVIHYHYLGWPMRMRVSAYNLISG